MQKNFKRIISMYFMISICLCISACGTVKEEQTVEESEINSEEYNFQPESSEEDSNTEDNDESIIPPSKEEVIAMRRSVLEGMNEDEIERLTENIKVANLRMESAYLNDNIFHKLSDSDSPYWQYFDKAGDIQLGWWYNGQIVDKDVILRMEGITETEFDEREYEPGIVYNRFDAANFIELVEDMVADVQNEMLRADLQQLIDLTYIVRRHIVGGANCTLI